MDSDKLEGHLVFCGSRTDLCELCNRYIQKKDSEIHNETGCEYPSFTSRGEARALEINDEDEYPTNNSDEDFSTVRLFALEEILNNFAIEQSLVPTLGPRSNTGLSIT